MEDNNEGDDNENDNDNVDRCLGTTRQRHRPLIHLWLGVIERLTTIFWA